MTDRELEKLERGLNHRHGRVPPRPEQLEKRQRLEDALTRLRGVRRAKVTLEQARFQARVLTLPERTEESTKRDVQALAARIGIDPPSLETTVMGPRPKTATARRKLSSLSTKRYDQRFSAQVTLELEGDALMGEVDVPAGRRFEFRSVARAVLESARPLIPYALQLEHVELFNFGADRLAVVSVSSNDDVLIGSALVKGDELDTIARATLDAVNRILQLGADRLAGIETVKA